MMSISRRQWASILVAAFSTASFSSYVGWLAGRDGWQSEAAVNVAGWIAGAIAFLGGYLFARCGSAATTTMGNSEAVP